MVRLLLVWLRQLLRFARPGTGQSAKNRALRRCLWELFCGISRDARLEFVLGPAQEVALQEALLERFEDVQVRLG
jgi:hypothetical protein